MGSTTFTPIAGTSIQTPTADTGNLQRVAQQLKEAIEIGQRLRGSVGDSFVRVSELQSAFGARVVNNTIQPPSTTSYLSTVETTDSISGTGATSSPIQLVGDAANPGNNMVYGTNGSGTRGWYSASGAVSPISITDGTHTVTNAATVTFSGAATVSGTSPNAVVTVAGTTGAAGPQGPAIFLDADPYQGEDGFPIPGPQGPPGTGAPGPQGASGVATYLEAEPGLDGDMGPPGPPGPAGVGTTGAQGPTGLSMFVEDGMTGEDGMPGVGPPGPTGAAGVNGFNGVTMMVEDGAEGEMGMPIPGQQGIQGITGAQGPAGSGAGITIEDPPYYDDLYCVGPHAPVMAPTLFGPVIITPPVSGAALTVNGVAQTGYSPTMQVTVPNTTDQSNGLVIRAGTSINDANLVLTSANGTYNYFAMLGDGSWNFNRSGSVQTLAGSNAGNITIAAPSSGVALTVAGQVWAQNNNQSVQSILGIGLVFSGTTTQTYYKVATLPASSGGTFDSLTIRATLNDGWGSGSMTELDLTIGNRNGFSYNYTSKGSLRSDTAVKCYLEANGTTSVYLVTVTGFGYIYADIFATSGQVTLSSSLPSTTAPTGTLNFDTTNYASYPPRWTATDAGAISVGTYTNGGSAGDVVCARSTTTGALYLGSNLSHYLYFDGTSYNFGGGAPVTTNGGLITAGGITVATNNWNVDSGGQKRFYWGSTGDSYFEIGGGSFHWRNSSDVDMMNLDNTGGLYMAGATGGDKGAGTINATGLYINGAAVVAATTGSFTGTLTGLTTTVTGTCYWTKVGTSVTLFIPSMSGTSNSTSLAMTGVPAAIQMASFSKFVPCNTLTNNTTTYNQGGAAMSANSGTLTFYLGTNSPSNTGFTASGSKGIQATVIVYDTT